MQTRTLERRVTSGEVELRTSNGKTFIEGYAAVFDKLSQNLGGFVETVRRGAFAKTIQEADVRALLNHDANLVLGRNKASTLELSEDKTGLYYRITPPDTTYAHDLMAVMERGDISQSSFAFYTLDDDWGLTEQEFPVRALLEVHLVDVSPVTYPAYVDTEAGLGGRSAALVGLAKRSGLDVAELADPAAIKRAISTPTEGEPAGQATPSRWNKRAESLAALTSVLTDS